MANVPGEESLPKISEKFNSLEQFVEFRYSHPAGIRALDIVDCGQIQPAIHENTEARLNAYNLGN